MDSAYGRKFWIEHLFSAIVSPLGKLILLFFWNQIHFRDGTKNTPFWENLKICPQIHAPMNKSFSFNIILLRCRSFYVYKAPRTSSRPSLVFFFSSTVAFWSSLVEDIDGGQGWTTVVCAPWKRFICYVEWRGDHGSSLLVAIILRSFLFPLGARNFPRSPNIPRSFRSPPYFRLFVVWLTLFIFNIWFLSREEICPNGDFPSVWSDLHLPAFLNKQIIFPTLFIIVTAFLRSVYRADDHSSFVRWNRVFFRIMKPICAVRTANVKVNEGFWTRRGREHIFRKFHRKISAP